MRFTTLSKLIRDSFEDETRRGAGLPGRAGEALLAPLDPWQIVRAMRDPAMSLEEQDAILAAAIRCYRRAPAPAWSALLLEMLSPTLVGVSSRFPYTPNGLTEEDVQQQVIVEALHAAMFMRLPEQARYTRRRLRQQVVSRTARWLTRTARAEDESLEQVAREGTAHRDADQVFLLELLDRGVPRESLALLYRSQVLGMTVRELAVQMGVSMSAVHRRHRRAFRHLRTSFAANNQRSRIEEAAAA